jgi:hypothetical protein
VVRGLSCAAIICAFFERATGFEIGGDAGRPEGMAADLDPHAELGGAPLDHAIGVDPVHGLAVQFAGPAADRAEEEVWPFPLERNVDQTAQNYSVPAFNDVIAPARAFVCALPSGSIQSD